MTSRSILSAFCFLWLSGTTLAQQAPDLDYTPKIARPTYQPGKGPRVAIDEAHHNFHTADNRFKPFAKLLRRDGYRVDGLSKAFSVEALRDVDILVIANALNERNQRDWSLPTPSAFTREEITAVRTWVEDGGSLFLIADHMPFPGATHDLAQAFGVEFSNGFAFPNDQPRQGVITFTPKKGLEQNEITQGRNENEKVKKVVTFTGSAFKKPKDAIPVLVFGEGSVSLTPKKAWAFTPDTSKEDIEGWCQGAVMKVGKGRVAIFGEAAMFTAQLAGAMKRRIGMNSPEADQNYRLLLNVMRWLSQSKNEPE